MFKGQLLPQLDDVKLPIAHETSEKNPEYSSSKRSRDRTFTKQTSIGSSSSNQSARLIQQPQQQNRRQIDLVPVVRNSQLVHQRATAGDHLAAASVTTGASLPLMIGGRSKCVVNLLDNSPTTTAEQLMPLKWAQTIQHQPNTKSDSDGSSSVFPLPQVEPPSIATSLQPTTISSTVPQNTALRAEQRRQNMSVSVVRPVVNMATTITNRNSTSDGLAPNYSGKSMETKSSLIDDLMFLEQSTKTLNPNENLLEQLMLDQRMEKLDLNGLSVAQQYMKSEQEIRRQELLLRREEHDLNRCVRRQHQFVINKIDERKRHLQIIQSIWYQRDFKHAIEKMVDIYHQGLVFLKNPSSSVSNQKIGGRTSATKINQLSSINTSLVVDVIGIIILRPKLWNLEICQLLLPIIINDLLMQDMNQHEYYIEVGLRALKLILTYFSSVIKSTLESFKDLSKLTIGVDLSHEDRINKCLACYKLLLEAHLIVQNRICRPISNKDNEFSDSRTNHCKLEAQYRELNGLFDSLKASISLDPLAILRRQT